MFVAKFEFLFQKGLNFGAVPHARSNWSIIFGGASGAFSLVYISVFIATQCQVNSRVLELTFHNNMRPVKKGRKIGCPSMRPMKKRPQDRLYVYEAFEKRPHILGCLRRLLIGLFGGASGAILLDRHGLWYRNQFAPTSGHSLSRRPRILTGHIALSRPSRRGGWTELKIFLTRSLEHEYA